MSPHDLPVWFWPVVTFVVVFARWSGLMAAMCKIANR
jgi:hypothetical protein